MTQTMERHPTYPMAAKKFLQHLVWGVWVHRFAVPLAKETGMLRPVNAPHISETQSALALPRPELPQQRGELDRYCDRPLGFFGFCRVRIGASPGSVLGCAPDRDSAIVKINISPL